jgi:protein SCO1
MLAKIAWRRVGAALAVAVLFAGAVTAIVLTRASHSDAAVELPQIGGHFALSTSDGRRVTDETFRGKWLIIYFGYTGCPDVCPTTLSSMGVALQKLGPSADKIQPIFITVDPARDTAEVVGEYVKDFDPRLIGLVGSSEEIAAAAKDFHVYYQVRRLGNDEYVVDHSSFLYVIDPSGRFVRLLTADLPGHQLAEELGKLIN